jgi:RNA polymerase sigma factor (sigma-70 family)
MEERRQDVPGDREDDVRRLLRERRYEIALERLLDLYQKKVFRLAVVMLKDRARAEETTQDVFLKVWRALPAYDGRATLSTWIYTIARNTCLSAVRNESYRRTDPLDESREPAAGSTVARDVELEQGLSRLPAFAASRRASPRDYALLPAGPKCEGGCRHARPARGDGEKPPPSRAPRAR